MALAGRSGVAPIQSFAAKYMPTTFAAEAREFTGAIDDFGPLEGEKKKAIRKGLKVMCRECADGRRRGPTRAGRRQVEPTAASIPIGSACCSAPTT